MRIILLGPPGSGKGTQGDLIAQKYSLPKVSTGDLLREAVQQGTSLGKLAEKAMNKGELVSDDLVLQIVDDRIGREDCRKGYILDGFPRNIQQALMLDALDKSKAEVVLEIRVSEKLLIERLSSRRVCPDCGSIYNLLMKTPNKPGLCDVCGAELIQRPDDMADVIRERLHVYHVETEPLINYYQKKNNYHKIDGDSSIESVFQNIQAVLKDRITEFDRSEAIR